jgi:nucleotide-binding universal stress UspA family protein
MNEIVVGVDGSETSRRAAHKAAEIAAARGVGLHLVTTVQRNRSTVRGGGESWQIDSLSDGEQQLRSLAVGLTSDEVPITMSVQYGDPAEAMCAEADRHDASMIVVGNRRVQSAARVLGTIATHVTRIAGCDVLIVNTSVGDDPSRQPDRP